MVKMKKKLISLSIFLLVVLIGIAACLLIHYHSLSSAEKEFYQYWYLDNVGNKLVIQDDSNTNNTIVTPQAGVDINAFQMWQTYQTLKAPADVVVALLDTGVDSEHDLIRQNLWNNPNDKSTSEPGETGYVETAFGASFVELDPSGSEKLSSQKKHGTMCAGILAKVANTDHIKLMSLAVLTASAESNDLHGSAADIVNAIHYAENNGARLCNLSMGSLANSDEIFQAMKQSNMLFILSAGNGSGRGISLDGTYDLPAIYQLDNVITVANLNYNGRLNKESNYGVQTVTIAAPGTSMLTAVPGNRFEYGTGTSMAAPVVSGISAVMMSANPELTASDVKQILCETAASLPDLQGKIITGGMVDGGAAVSNACGAL